MVGRRNMLVSGGVGVAAGVAAATLMPSAVRSVRDRRRAGAAPRLKAMERLVHIARIRQGNEADVRRLIEERFPRDAIARVGIREMTVFVGSGYCITEYGYDREYTPLFRALRDDPEIAAYLQELGRLLDDAPAPRADEPGRPYLASQALRWDGAGGVEFTPRLRSSEASRDRT